MSKKDYQAIARVIHSARLHHPMADELKHAGIRNGVLAEIILGLSDVMAADNPAFDRARFLEACETGTTKGMPR